VLLRAQESTQIDLLLQRQDSMAPIDLGAGEDGRLEGCVLI
jgi:hypothetical protein